MAVVRQDMTFRGHVQGVGFRFTAARIAAGRPVEGWVRNEPDGSVRCVVEGEESEVDQFMTALCDAMAGHILKKSIHRHAATGEYRGFEIRR